MQKSHAVAFQDVAGRLCLGQRNRMLSLVSQPVAGKAAEPAASIAGAGNGEMADPGAAISQGAQRHFPDGWGLCDAVGHCLLPTRPVPRLIGYRAGLSGPPRDGGASLLESSVRLRVEIRIGCGACVRHRYEQCQCHIHEPPLERRVPLRQRALRSSLGPQNEPTKDPSKMITTSAMIGPTIAAMTISK